ncbi:MAG: endopeptidase La [Deltaproteobacteria bacterium CG23_combo_of_CG06-09_8_20_14_all_60_8]|nr:MAG: endopeptidase La [Desulfobacterales bacterium CG2_30_60_27]PIP42906.1 MAG: endopeptidase La [Deltaproteobacteria bacterium CG23_combo_of_CG06-09_8_20_14_all_60_8]
MTDLHFVLRSYPMMSLRDIVLFPHMVAPLVVGRKKSIQALEEAIANHSEIFLATQKNASDEDPKQAGVHTVGTVAGVLQLLRLPDGTIKALVEGRRRARIIRYLPHEEFFRVEVEELLETGEINAETEAFVRQIRTVFGGYVKHSKKIPPEVVKSLANIADPARFVDVLVSHLPLATIKKQEILSAFAIQARLEIALSFLNIENEIVSMEETIRTRVKKKMEKSQKDYYLAEQIRALQKEMGADNDAASELDELDKQIRRKKLPQAARAKVKREFKKLKLMQPMSAEATVVRNYIDVILSLPWSEKSRERVEILAADAILEEDHFGLAKPKERILEYLAVQAQVKTMRGPILCLVGPPGVGKTSLCKSVARAMGRKFVRLSLGGVRDEAEIRGHRRTYIGAMPGKIIQSLRKAKVNNPVFCLDEVDKMSMDFRGDPSAALLEVLDPEQNNAFNDHYLDLDFDLSDVFFITTANNLPSIPPPLRDRMEIIKLEGYTEEDKLRIATDFLVPKQLAANGFTDADIVFNDKAILEVVQRYTREAGVRNLERSIAAICRKIARDRLKNGADKKYRVAAPAVARYLGVPRYRVGQAEDIDRTGLVTGLAWTEVGGELLQIEAVLMPGKGKLIITGKLGEVMQESAQAALSYVRSRALRLGLAPDFYQKVDIHVHVPEGAIPKDGPSAGITMATAIASALLQLPVRKDIAMTGEITLRGRVLPIGGLTEKLLAARRGHIRNVLVPKENERDLEEIPAKIRKSLRIDLVENMDEVLTKALVLGEGATLFKEVSMAAFCPEVMLPVDTPIAHQ